MADVVSERVAVDLKDALRQNDETRKTTLRLLRAALQRASEVKRSAAVDAARKKLGGDWEQAAAQASDDAGALTDEEALAVVQREVKQRRDSITEYEKGHREDLAAAERAEIVILQAYLPQQLSREQVEVEARAVIQEVGASGLSQQGQVMKALMPRLKNQADGKLVSDVVRSLLSGN